MKTHIKPLGPTLGPLRWAISNPIKARLKQKGINLPFDQLIVLKMLRLATCEVVQQDVAEQLGKDKSVIMRMVDALEKDDFLKRIVDCNDRRRNQLTLTELGNKLMDQYDEIEMEISMELLEGLSDSDIDTFYKVIDHMKVQGEKLNRQ
ncbi:MAG: hypothetical protein QM786_09605 [Breznakibacter sp.]